MLSLHLFAVSAPQVMKTYHMYHSESISAESKLKDAEKQEEKQFSKSGDLNVNLLRHDDRQPRRGFVRKIEKMKEKVSAGVGFCGASGPDSSVISGDPSEPFCRLSAVSAWSKRPNSERLGADLSVA